MNLRNQILQANTKENCNKIVAWIGKDRSKFNELFNLFMKDGDKDPDLSIRQRAAWPLSYCAIAHPEFMENNFGKVVQNLKKPLIHNSIKRYTVRLLQSVEIPGK